MKTQDIINNEKTIYKFWMDNDLFKSKVDCDKKAYTIVIPPPNVTGSLHLGHALNNTIQDVLIRFHKMKGCNTCWLPGTDHAGIATQSVIEKKLMDEEGKTRHDIGREKMIDRIWDWVNQYGNRIILQLKSMGFACDWSRLSFTMDEKISYAVKYVFNELFQEGLIYKDKRLINWCPGCRTALSNDELEYEESDSFLWDIRYPIKGKDDCFLVVSTTRPETMLGDTAVAVHPEDDRYKHLIGEYCLIPIINREIPVIADHELVDMEYGTGVVKVTPGHDPNDFACGKRNNLEIINILNPDCTLNENAHPYTGLTIDEGRKKLLADLKYNSYLLKEAVIKNNKARCYRSSDIVEPILSNQWFVKMKPLVKIAKESVENEEVKFIPANKKNDLLRWLECTPDWCISRQIWWGHRINVWYCIDCNKIKIKKNGEPESIPEKAKPILPSKESLDKPPKTCDVCRGSNLVQDPDLLDTWFSSQLWPLSTFGWPLKSEDLNYFYPTNTLCTDRNILALWVARMIMIGKKFTGKNPFEFVNIHGTILDDKGDIMSKSRGNGVDPLALISGGEVEVKGKFPVANAPAHRVEVYPSYGADSLRFALMYMTLGQSQDIKLKIDRKKRSDGKYDVTVPKVEEALRFINKLCQATYGVVFSNIDKSFKPIANLYTKVMNSNFTEDKWLLSMCIQLSKDFETYYKEFKFGKVCDDFYHFVWNDFCSYYLEIVKTRLWGKDGTDSEMQAKNVSLFAIETLIKLIQPVMPFMAEEIWRKVKTIKEKYNFQIDAKACMVVQYPNLIDQTVNKESLEINNVIKKIIYLVNNIKSENDITKKIPEIILSSNDKSTTNVLATFKNSLERILKVNEIKFQIKKVNNSNFFHIVVSSTLDMFVNLAGVVDLEKKETQFNTQLNKLLENENHIQTKLKNIGFLQKAPHEIVKKEKAKLADIRNKINKLKSLKNIC